MDRKKAPVMLMILDGYGLSEKEEGNAIRAAVKPGLDRIFAEYPNVKINASGMYVGLPDGQMGNSEVGHLNIGAGRIVYQELTKITKSIKDGDFFRNEALLGAVEHVKKNSSALHIYGLMSDGGVHSHISHVLALVKLAAGNGIEKLYVHCFTDGRDVPPTSGADYIKTLEDELAEVGAGSIGVVSGRYYAMDRDKRWERVKLAYDALTLGAASGADTENDAYEAVKKSYDAGVTDEFIKPVVCGGFPGICDGDAVIFANFRPDRAREITRAFVDPLFEEAPENGGQGGFERTKKPEDLYYVCMTQYDSEMPGVHIAFPPRRIENTLGEYISSLGLNQLRIAETEKYAHVTFFFNGGVEEANPNEDRILVPSPKVATYDLQPEMSAYGVKDKVLEAIESGRYDLIILNFANSDMVGHTGVFEAAVKAVEALDTCVSEIVRKMLEKGGRVLLTADHGNADCMLDDSGNVVTAHSTNPVPVVNIAENAEDFSEYAKSGEGKLADLAPTLLKLMGLEIPEEMTGTPLI